MIYPESLQEALKSGDLIAIRAALIAIVDRDKNRSTPQATKIADAVSDELHSKNISLFVADNGRYKLPPEGDWTIDTWHGIKAAMQTNFSREKFVWADQVRIKVFGVATDSPGKRESVSTGRSSQTLPRVLSPDMFSSRYEIIEPLRKAIESKDLIAIRSALIAMVDRDYSKTKPIARNVAMEVSDYLKPHTGIELFEPDNGRLILPPPDEWTKDTWHGVKAAMQTNFSKEKFVLAEEIMRALKQNSPAPRKQPGNISVDTARGDSTPIAPSLQPKPINESPKETIRPRPHINPQPYSHRSDKQPALFITGGMLIIGGIVVGAVVAGTIGAIIGGGAGLAVSVKILNTRK